MSANELPLVTSIVHALRVAGADVWLFGGWAEELRGMRDPTPHADIDLLLRSANFGQLESILSDLPTAIEIAEKRFSHKRAFEWMGVRVEVLLVTVPSMETHVFDGRYIVRWPNDTFADAPVGSLPVASRAALGQYRANHRRVRCAYREHLNDLRLLDEPTATH